HWHSFEYDSFDNIPYDFGYVVFSTDMETWYVIHEVFGNSNGWEEVVIDLSDLAGQTISLGFYAYSDSLFTYPGWYIDDVALLDQLPEGVTKEEVSSQSIATTNYKSIKLESTTVTEGITVDAEEPSGLPLVAQITVVETGRSTKSSPANGTFELRHPAGEYTIVAEAYGYETKSETVTVNHHEETAVHFHLEPLALGTLNGKVIDENTGTPVEGASIYLIEDANIQSGKTDANGSFTMTPYEGTYTMRVIAPGYYTAEKTVTIIGDTVTYEEVALTLISGLTHEIAYDDVSEEYRNAWYGPGNGWAVKMTLADGKDSAILSATKLKFNHE